MTDPFDLQRFVDAQAPVWEKVRLELSRGKKESHWMWFIFPQLKELGHSQMANRYGIASREEAVGYIAHPVLGARLIECADLVLKVDGDSALDILGHPDDRKFQSCMTLFNQVAPSKEVFAAALDKYFDGQLDMATIDLLRR